MATITSKIRIGLIFSSLLVLLTGCGLHQSSQTPARTWETNQEEQQRQSRFIKKIGQNAKLVYQKNIRFYLVLLSPKPLLNLTGDAVI